MKRGFITKVSWVAGLLAVMAACKSGPKPPAVIGEAFVGPVVLQLRSDIPPQSPTVATAKHGDKLDILGRRRRYMRVRTASGAEGWTDDRLLLASEEMDNLRDLSKRAAGMPPQGRATTFGDLNVHTQPSLQSPSFIQIKENEKFDVLAQVRLPRTDLARKPLIPPAEKKAKAVAKKKPAKEPAIPPLPMPKPPPLPENWLELSKTDLGDDDGPDESPDAVAKPVPLVSWSLVRVDGGQSGWVLTRRVTMAIPDEVAQYAEGKRIVSYFPLGSVDDGGEKKMMWLWTTSSGASDYDFDSIRVFSWSLRKHRYETAYIDRNIYGFAPVVLREVQYGKDRYPGFSICTEKSGGRVRREYAVMGGNAVRYAGELPCEAPVSPVTLLTPPVEIKTSAEAGAQSGLSFTERVTRRVKGWFKR